MNTSKQRKQRIRRRVAVRDPLDERLEKIEEELSLLEKKQNEQIKKEIKALEHELLVAGRARELAEAAHKANDHPRYVALIAFAFAQETMNPDAWEVAQDAFADTGLFEDDVELCREMAKLIRLGAKNPSIAIRGDKLVAEFEATLE